MMKATAMRFRPLGKTGVDVSEIGYGAWGIGGGWWTGSDDEESLRSLQRAVDLGVNFFDTAAAYGDGHSERLLGRLLSQLDPGTSPALRVASKIPPANGQWPPVEGTPLQDAFPRDHCFRVTEETLRNLGRDALDLQQFHAWLEEWAEDDGWLRTVEELKASGLVRAVGISLPRNKPWTGLEAAHSGVVDSFQVVYNLFEQAPEDELFPLCRELEIGVIARVPLDEGGLSGTLTAGSRWPEADFRSRYFAGDMLRETIERAKTIERDLVGGDVESLAEGALRFCLSHEAVSTVIPGMRTAAHVAANVEAVEKGALPAPTLARMRKRRWDR